jgi:dTDP-L-rhamnose 4-epimerase
MIGRSYGMPTVALRFFNVYGTRQALSNPYTGVLAIFAARLLNDKPPLIFEDGYQRRDFVHVSDIARGIRLALETQEVSNTAINIGSGRSYTILEVADAMGRSLEKPYIEPEIAGTYRMGDIRHCFSSIERAQRLLGFEPQKKFEEGLRELADWLQTQMAVDLVDTAHSELSKRGLTL